MNKFILSILFVFSVFTEHALACDGFNIPYFAQNHFSDEKLNYSMPDAVMAYNMTKPCHLIDDFNGDKVDDYIALLKNTDTEEYEVMAVYSSHGNYLHQRIQVITHAVNDGHLWAYLKRNIGETYIMFEGVIDPEGMGISIVYIEKSSHIYYWDGTQFSSIGGTD